ncbi:DEAD/DEAH box helicase family protein, partial [Alphaproteobacteria bacterium]|nr:DEAD/DEAH box helicase family protein [Alphaproteobacteria bacterium]
MTTFTKAVLNHSNMASRIDTLISKCRSWDEFVEMANSQAKTKDKGDLFERLTQVYLQTAPTYQATLKKVYLLSDKTMPERLRVKLNLPDNDEGIDLICETRSGDYWSVQCKYKSDQSSALTHKELSTFTSLSFNTCKGISLGLVVHTATKPVRKSDLMPNVTEVGLEKWLEISDADWKRITKVCRSNKLEPPKKRKPRIHQKAAIADAKKHFIDKRQKRGKLIMPCGTGKSLTAYWIAQALGAKSIIVAVPSLALVRQSLADWTAEYLAEGQIPEWLAVCSDVSVGSARDADSTVATVYETGIPTNPTDEELDTFLTKRSKAPKIVFTTYQSAEKLCEAAKRTNKTFDLMIADEAHKTVGRRNKSFATLLFDENIKVKKRLFMTATERVYNASKDDVVSMDDPDIYGSTCHQLSFKEAIKQKIICDYKIVTIAVSDSEIDALIRDKAELAVSAGNKTIETDAHSLAAGIAMQKAFKKYGIKHAITFHSSIKRAESFKDQQEDLPNNAHISHSHISSKFSAGQRAKLLKAFAEEEHSVITNARCLTEGVDIRAIDCVAFVDPKRSTVDIVQAAGRAMRQSKETDKDYGYVIIPIFIQNGETIEDVKLSDRFADITKIITSLSTQDERIKEELKFNSVGDKKPHNSQIIFDDDLAELLKIDLSQIEVPLRTLLWQKVGNANWMNFNEAREFARKLRLKTQSEWHNYVKSEKRPYDIPTNPRVIYQNNGWLGYGDWLGTGRIATQNINYPSFEKARAYVRKLNLKSYDEWQAWKTSGKRPDYIVGNPQRTYRDKGWISFPDWMGYDGW